eukprot:TRINITY_DN109111_c0_g1_i8.p1 TRINITY_DN109111_c0_g1~~TRINITY_DN109111_c0_g1_i8.p1  ORF type:complete len:167 (-),score=48.46 TRINITY_DN109111_c0_g1_i8:10-510(-)
MLTDYRDRLGSGADIMLTDYRDRLGSGADIMLTDYRDAQGQYDAIASVEMVEAVGERYWPAYLAAVHRLLKPGGKAAIQYILIDDALFESYARGADFIQAYIFPGGMLISEGRFRALTQAQGLEWRDVHRQGGPVVQGVSESVLFAEIGRAVQQECRDRSRMPSSA